MEILFAISILLGGTLLLDLFSSDGDQSGPPTAEDENETINGTGGNDTLEGNAFDNLILGGSGEDRIEAGEGDDIVDGGGDADFIFGEDGNDTVDGGAGADVVSGGDGEDQVSGGQGDDSISGEVGNDTLIGGAGNDTLGVRRGGGEIGDDLLDGGDGNDSLFGGEGLDTLLGGDGDDSIFDDIAPFYGASNASVIDAGAGDDRMFFTSGSTVTGGAGSDEFNLTSTTGDAEAAVITDFNPDEDILNLTLVDLGDGMLDLSVVEREDGTGVNLLNGDVTLAEFLGTQDLALDDIFLEILVVDPVGDVTGSAADEWIRPGYGDDFIDGGAGNDTIGGDAFNNGLGYVGEDGNDLLLGGAGDDVIRGSGYTINSDFPTDNGPQPAELILHGDTLVGGTGNDILLSNGNNVMIGGDGADTFGLDADAFFDAPVFAEPSPYPPSIITDFDPSEDVIVVDRYHVSGLAPPAPLSVVVWPDGTGADIRYGDIVLAQVDGGQSLTPDDIKVVEFLGALGVT